MHMLRLLIELLCFNVKQKELEWLIEHKLRMSFSFKVASKTEYYDHWRQSGVNSAGARRGFLGILLQKTYYILISSQKSSATRSMLSKAEWLDRLIKNDQKRTENKSFLEYFKS